MVGLVIWEERFARTDRVFVGVFPEAKGTFFWPDNTKKMEWVERWQRRSNLREFEGREKSSALGEYF